MEIVPSRQKIDVARVEDIKGALDHKSNLKLVGDLSILSTYGGIEFYGRRILYVEPQNPPPILVLSDRQVDALNASGYFKRAPTPELAAIPLQFAREYNAILRGLRDATGIPFNVDPFQFLVSHLDTHLNYLGSLIVPIIFGQSEVTVTTATSLQVMDESMAQQAIRLANSVVERYDHDIEGSLWVELFPPGLGSIIHAYDKGYYVDGNVAKWREVTYRNRYTDPYSLTFEQLQDLAKGEKPYPEITYLDRSIFETMTEEEARRELRRRTASIGSMRSTLHEYFRTYPGGDFDEDSYNPTEKRQGDPTEKHTHHGNETVWDTPNDSS